MIGNDIIFDDQGFMNHSNPCIICNYADLFSFPVLARIQRIELVNQCFYMSYVGSHEASIFQTNI